MSAVIFDLDGVLVDSEQAWDQARKDVVAANGGAWKDSATRDMREGTRAFLDKRKPVFTGE